MAIQLNPPEIVVYVGSTNPVKCKAAEEAIRGNYPSGSKITVIKVNASPGIEVWKSKYALQQPVGLEETCFGAVHRMKDCWEQAKPLLEEAKLVYAVGMENGLVPQDGGAWDDVGITAIRSTREGCVIKRAKAVFTQYVADQKTSSFDDQMLQYQELIRGPLQRKEDLYRIWTGGKHDRGYFLRKALSKAVCQLIHFDQAKALIDSCALAGAVASLGQRYNKMLWTRDLAYMTAAYLRGGDKQTVLNALRILCEQQCSAHQVYDNGYEQVTLFGRIPTVCIPQDKERDFLLQRISGSEKDPSWMVHLWNYCKTNCPDALSFFPTPHVGAPPIEGSPSLSDCQVQDLRNFYFQLQAFQSTLSTKDSAIPGPSFSLRRFMEGKLFDITPGTNDAEIHFIRSLFQVVHECDESEKEKILNEFAKPLANALFYLHMNVLDPKDGLPMGCDCRDTFADLLYDSKTCTNALFWYEALQALVSQAKILEQTPLRQYLREAIAGHKACSSKPVPKHLEELAACSIETILTQAAHDLEPVIKQTFFMQNGGFSPIDFVPGQRAIARLPGDLPEGLVSPIVPTPILPLIIEHNLDFIHGTQIDPQSLARAVLLGFIPREQYDQVVDYFRKNDSPIGVEVFIPISGTKTEKELLDKVHGRVVWPHISWTVVRALIAMGTQASLEMAEQQAKKLMKLPGLGEWYAQDPHGTVVQGGDPCQGWTASSLILAMEDLNKSARESPVCIQPLT